MTTPRIAVSNRYRTALADASIWHQHQFRKGSDIPYLSHLLAVSAAVMEDGGDEDETIAGLLHDSIEDTGVTVEVLVARYGHRVADIVAACTDDWGGDAINKAPWWPRKVHHIGHVTAAGESTDISVIRVTAADKLANLRSTLDDGDPQVYARFKAGIGGFAWYHDTFGGLLVQRLGSESLLSRRLSMALRELGELVSMERTRLGGAVGELGAKFAEVAVPEGSGPYSPWPWFAFDAVHRTGGAMPTTDAIATAGSRGSVWPFPQRCWPASLDPLGDQAGVSGRDVGAGGFAPCCCAMFRIVVAMN